MCKEIEKNNIYVVGAREKNLKNISVEIPKKKITVFTGVSGSGKSSLVFDTIAAESQRQLNETYTSFIRNRLPHYGQPNVDYIKNLPVAFVINQKRLKGNARSTVGTITDIYSLLRLLFSRIGKPFVGYSEVFSFNNPSGMCLICEGIGSVETINIEKLLDKDKSLNEGAICFPTFEPGGWRLKRYIHTGLFDNNKKIRDYSDEELELLLYKSNMKIHTQDPEWPKTSLYEGVIPRIERSFLKKEDGEKLKYKSEIEYFVNKIKCPECEGGRLNKEILSCKINNMNIVECSQMQVSELIKFLSNINDPKVTTVVSSLLNQLQHMVSIGLGYLSLNRETNTLSGGESQRIKMVRQLGSSLTDITYIFDEPSIGLHPYNIDKINELFKSLRDKGNTILIVEHDPDIIEIADNIIDIGPKAGINGGEIVYQGNLNDLKKSNTLTGKALLKKQKIKYISRKHSGKLSIKNARLHNLKNVSVDIPKGVLNVITGVAGSGKSTLINQVLPKFYPEAIFIDQKGIQSSKRSNILTYTGIFDGIRKLFSKANNVNASLFSFNSKGACPECKGLGVLYTDLAFMDTAVNVCEVCQGDRYKEEVLNYKLHGKSISDVLKITVDEAIHFFNDDKILRTLKKLKEVGIDYVTLGQPLNTLSGGELKRIKLSTELEKSGNIYVLDEPTTGLHMSDISKLLQILNKIVDEGNTLIIIEHNLDVISMADWIIDIGLGAGQEGGEILFEGTPEALLNCKKSLTAKYFKKYIQSNEV